MGRIAQNLGTMVAGETYTFTAAPLSGKAPLEVSFDASASTDDGTIASYVWDFGNTATGSGVTTTHTYAADGTYTARLTVTDNDGLTDTATKTITVSSLSTANWIGGDGNGDGKTGISDAVALLTFLFVDNTKTLACLNTMELNGDSARDISDAVFLLTFLFVDDTKAPYGDPTYTKKCVKVEGCGIEDPSCK